MRVIRLAIAAVMLVTAAQPTDAAIIVTALEVGSDVVISGGGTVDLSGLTYVGTVVAGPVVVPNDRLILGTYSPDNFDQYSGLSGPANIGIPATASFPFFKSGTLFGLYFPGTLIVPKDYSSGNSLSASITFTPSTFASLGVIPGTYVWTWGQGRTADSFTLQIGPPAAVTPEPTSLALAGFAGLGLAAGAWRRRRQHKQQPA